MGFNGIKAAGAVILVACLVSMCVIPASVQAGPVSPAQHVVLLEACIDVACSYCYGMVPIYNQLWTNYGPTQLAIINYHVAVGDPFANPDSGSRYTYYGAYGVPWHTCDGVLVGGKMDYASLESAVTSRFGTSALAISMTGSVASGSVDVSVSDTGGAAGTNLKVRYAILEQNLWCGPVLPENPKGIWYNFTCRDMLTEDPLTLPLPPSGVTFMKTFSLDPSWTVANLSFVAFIQSDSDRSVKQACVLGPSAVPEVPLVVVFPVAGLIVALVAAGALAQRKGGRED